MPLVRCTRCWGSGREPLSTTTVWRKCVRCFGDGRYYEHRVEYTPLVRVEQSAAKGWNDEARKERL